MPEKTQSLSHLPPEVEKMLGEVQEILQKSYPFSRVRFYYSGERVIVKCARFGFAGRYTFSLTWTGYTRPTTREVVDIIYSRFTAFRYGERRL